MKWVETGICLCSFANTHMVTPS